MLGLQDLFGRLFNDFILCRQWLNFGFSGHNNLVILGSIQMMELVHPRVFVLLRFFFLFFFLAFFIALVSTATISTSPDFLVLTRVIPWLITILLLRLGFVLIGLVFLRLLSYRFSYLRLFNGLSLRLTLRLILFRRVFRFVYSFFAHDFDNPINKFFN